MAELISDEECDALARSVWEADGADQREESACGERRALIRAAVARGMEMAAGICKEAVPRAHTYASENADVYRAADGARDRCIKAILARAKETR